MVTIAGDFLKGRVALPTLDYCLSTPFEIWSRMNLLPQPHVAVSSHFFSFSALLDTVFGLQGSFVRDNIIAALVCSSVATVSILSLFDRLLAGCVKRFIYANARRAALLFSAGVLSSCLFFSSFKLYVDGSIPLTTMWLAAFTASSLFAIPSMLTMATSPDQKSTIGKLFCIANASFASFAFGVVSSGRSDHMRSPLRCPTDAFSEVAAIQCYNCSSANADALQCGTQPLFTQIDIKTIIALGATLILVNAAFTYHYVRMRKRQGTHTSAPALWLLLALSIGPLVWAIWRIWRYRQNRRRKSQITEPLLCDPSLPSLSLSIDSTASLQLQKVHSRHVKINKHGEPKRGGAGTVQQAYWNGQTYAIKKPNFIDSMTERQTTKFLKELESQASLQHPNCVRVFAVCLEKNNVFIVMEWMYGGSLWQRLQQSRENSLAPQHNSLAPHHNGSAGGLILSARMRLKIARDICHGLQYMHSRGMVHGDIKSLNVLLDRDNNAKLCDFGCTSVRNLQTSSTILARSSSGPKLSFPWCAPEILFSNHQENAGEEPCEATFQSDVYALGIVMWELLTCTQPYERLSVSQICAKLYSKERPPLPDPVPLGFPTRYVDIIKRCWDEDPEQRPSAAEVHLCMIEIDPSTQPNEAVILFPPHHKVSDRFSILPYLTRALPLSCCAGVLQSIVLAAETKCRSPDILQKMSAYNLDAMEAQSIFVYTASQGSAICPTAEHGAPFSSYNAALRGFDISRHHAWADYSFVLHSALLKLPSVACTVYRGLNIPLSNMSHLYWRGGFVWLRSPTSTTTDKDKTMREFGQGADAEAAGTFMQLHVKNAKEIDAFSAVPGEQERIIPHNTCFRVLLAVSAADVKLLKDFGTLPPNVDLVVVEEVTRESADYSAALNFTQTASR